MSRCVVLCGGEDIGQPVFIEPEDFVICCDRGYLAAKKRGITPSLIVGDFDSYIGELPLDVEILTFPSKKDDTDGMLALKEGLKRGYKSFFIHFALGGRLDHTFANLQSLLFLKENGAVGQLVGASDIVSLLVNEKCRFKKQEGLSLSIYAFGGDAKGVTLTGVEYTLDSYTLKSSFPLGFGNSITDDYATIEVLDGALLIIESIID